MLESDDGSRAFIDGEPVIDLWSDHQAMKQFVTRKLTAGKHDLRIEYYQGGAQGVAAIWVGQADAPTR